MIATAIIARVQALTPSIGSTVSLGPFLSEDSDIPVDELKRILDNSMRAVSAVYVWHRQLGSLNGELRSVSFIYALQHETRPVLSIAEVLAQVENARAKKEEGQALMRSAREARDEEKARTAAKLLIEGDRELTGSATFMTVELSMTRKYPPVLMFHKGLPDWVHLESRANALASTRLKGTPTLIGVNRDAVGLPPVFHYRDDTGMDAYVDARYGRVSTTRDAFRTTAPPKKEDGNRRIARKQRIDAQWDEFLTHGIDISQFSLDGLTDLSRPK